MNTDLKPEIVEEPKSVLAAAEKIIEEDDINMAEEPEHKPEIVPEKPVQEFKEVEFQIPEKPSFPKFGFGKFQKKDQPKKSAFANMG